MADNHPGAIAVEGVDVLDKSIEVARLWVEDDGPATCLINPDVLGEPEMFGMLMVDTIRHAAAAYAQTRSITEDEALTRILDGVQMQQEQLVSATDPQPDDGSPA